MITREQILEIQAYCAEHGISQGSRLDELHINRAQFYRWQKRFRDEDEQGQGPESGSFVQLASNGVFMSPMMSPARTSGKSKGKSGDAQDGPSFLTIEMRTASGMAMRIQGSMSAAHLREIISASNV